MRNSKFREIFSLKTHLCYKFGCVHISVLTELCRVDGELGDGTVQGDCPSTAEVCLADGTCALRGRSKEL